MSYKPFYNTEYFIKYIYVGFLLLIFSIIVLLIFIQKWSWPVQEISLYNSEDFCFFSSVEFKRVQFGCWAGEYVTLVDMPCVSLHVNTPKHKGIVFYRNVVEKLENRFYNCSYIPTACQNSVDYLEARLKKTFEHYFPPLSEYFQCYTSSNLSPEKEEVNAILYLPDEFAFYFSLVVSFLGIICSASMIMYGCSFINFTKEEPKLLRKQYRSDQTNVDDYISESSGNVSTRIDFDNSLSPDIGELNINFARITKLDKSLDLSFIKRTGSDYCHRLHKGRIQPHVLVRHSSINSATNKTQINSKDSGICNRNYESD